jgi:hypothetical protein
VPGGVRFLQIINHFSEIEKKFMVKLKIISFDHYFRSHQTLKNAENIFQNTFYAETNRSLIKKKKKKCVSRMLK